MNRIEWAGIVFVTWVFAECIWWAVVGEWGATVDEAMTVLAGILIAVLTCPGRRVESKEQG